MALSVPSDIAARPVQARTRVRGARARARAERRLRGVDMATITMRDPP
jgi:hypothetical protein